jgi:ATP-dependent Clp protease adaptor protein ClpS
MSDQQSSVAEVEIEPVAIAVPDKDAAKPKPRQAPRYAIILHNDDHNGMDHVVLVLQKVFQYEAEKCIQLMLEAHKTGRSVVWTGMLEPAELKADQIKSCGPDPVMKAHGAGTLLVTIEPVPG